MLQIYPHFKDDAEFGLGVFANKEQIIWTQLELNCQSTKYQRIA